MVAVGERYFTGAAILAVSSTRNAHNEELAGAKYGETCDELPYGKVLLLPFNEFSSGISDG